MLGFDEEKYRRHLRRATIHAERFVVIARGLGGLGRAKQGIAELGLFAGTSSEKRLTMLAVLEAFLEKPGDASVGHALPVTAPDPVAVRELFEHLDRFVELLRFRNFLIAPACCWPDGWAEPGGIDSPADPR